MNAVRIGWNHAARIIDIADKAEVRIVRNRKAEKKFVLIDFVTEITRPIDRRTAFAVEHVDLVIPDNCINQG